MKRILFLSVLVFLFNSPAQAEKTESICTILEKVVAKGAPRLNLYKYLDEQWKYFLRENPEAATYLGYPGKNDRWSDRSLKTIARHEKETHCELAALKKIPRQGLEGEDRVTWDLAVRNLEMSIEGQKFGGKYLAIDHLGGLHTEVADMVAAMPKANKKDYENIISRLQKFPALVDQVEALLREGMEHKITPVKMFLDRVPAQFDRVLTAKVEESPLYAAFKEMNPNLSSADKKALQKRALEAIQNKTYPALKKLKTFLTKEYIPVARESISIGEMPKGKEWYAYLVKSHTTTDHTPEELHELGLIEVARITKEMEKIKSTVKFNGNLKEFNRFLLTDSSFFYSSPEELLSGYRVIAKSIDPELVRLFKTLPRVPYGVKEMPEYKAKEAPTAYYEGGSLEAGRPGYFLANTFDLKARPKWGMEALTLHEAVPGHHLQISIAQELKDLPEFRKHGGYTAFVEGWALYAESLGEEMGFYKDPYSLYGKLTYEIWRAVRLVVDTGIHTKGWSREKAIEYFAAAMPKSRLESEVEIDRYITWPGQALAYKVGQLKFLELRKKASTKLGDKFDLREFHDEVLRHGSLPLDVLDKAVAEWIQKQSTKKLKSAL